MWEPLLDQAWGTFHELEQPGLVLVSISMCHLLCSHGVVRRRRVRLGSAAAVYFNDRIPSVSPDTLIIMGSFSLVWLSVVDCDCEKLGFSACSVLMWMGTKSLDAHRPKSWTEMDTWLGLGTITCNDEKDHARTVRIQVLLGAASAVVSVYILDITGLFLVIAVKSLTLPPQWTEWYQNSLWSLMTYEIATIVN